MARRAARRLRVERQLLAERCFRALEQHAERRIVEPAQHQDLAARQQRAVQLEGGFSVVAPTSVTVPSST